MVKIDFDKQFAAYESFMHDQIMNVAEYDNYANYCYHQPDNDMGAVDFARYKAGMVMSEKQFWNGMVERNKVTKKVTKQALLGLN